MGRKLHGRAGHICAAPCWADIPGAALWHGSESSSLPLVCDAAEAAYTVLVLPAVSAMKLTVCTPNPCSASRNCLSICWHPQSLLREQELPVHRADRRCGIGDTCPPLSCPAGYVSCGAVIERGRRGTHTGCILVAPVAVRG